MLAIINAELVMKDHLIPEAVLFVGDGKIAGFGEMRTGLRADLILVDHKMNVSAVFLAGERKY